MTPKEIAEKYVRGDHDALTDQQEIKDMIADIEGCEHVKYVPMQKCPKCDGQGILSKPPWISGDQQTWDSTSVNHVCNVCNGALIIPMAEIKN